MENLRLKGIKNMKYFYFITNIGEIMNLELISNPESAEISNLYDIKELDGWPVHFMTANINDQKFLELVKYNNDEGGDITLPTTPIVINKYISIIKRGENEKSYKIK